MNKNDILKELLKEENIHKLAKDNKLTNSDLEDDFLTLYSYHLASKKCLNCPGLNNCQQDNLGYKPLITYNGHFNLESEPCQYRVNVEQDIKKDMNLLVVGTKLDGILESGEGLYINSQRNELLKKLQQIFNDYYLGKNPKGLFLSGPYGCGKSYIIGLYAKKFASRGTKVIFAYFPDLIRRIKSAISDGGVEEYVDELKNCDILVLDDFGGELISPYVRDEVLGSVLQDRMENHRLTFITTNLDKDNLHDHLAESNQKIDELRASRIEQRIFTLMDNYDFKDDNYRH